MTGACPAGEPGAADGAAWVEPVEDLDPAGGLFLVLSRGALHLFDLDAGAYLRVPGQQSNSFPHDQDVLRLTQVERWPKVGESFFIWVDQPKEYGVWDYWRQSSTISAIYRVVRTTDETHPGEAAADAGERGLEAANPTAKQRSVEAGRRLPEEVLPGLRVGLDGTWRVVMSASDWTVDDGHTAVVGPPELEWRLARDGDWDTLLTIYRVVDGSGLRLRLDVRHGSGWGPRSTSGIGWMHLEVGQPPPFPSRGSFIGDW